MASAFCLALFTCILLTWVGFIEAGHKGFEAQLYEDLLYDYNKIPRPVKNSTDVLMVHVGASLIRIIDVDEKNQVLTTNLWLEMQWVDSKLTWNPRKYGGITALHIPSDMIWIPDFVLYNNAAGDPDITIYTDALVEYDGRVHWQPPAIYKSFCPIDVTWFPYDLQSCEMKFGAWSYTGMYVDIHHINEEKTIMTTDANGGDVEFLETGMDLSFFYRSAEWDLLSLTAARHSVLYASCCGPEKYIDITYYFVLRRKTLFFTCNLIVPCFMISFLTTVVFYLSDHKITFSISILVTLTVFFLVLIDIIPPTSLVVPMFGRYLITTMILVALSTVISVVTVNFRCRRGAAHKMSPWIRTIFLGCLPRLLWMDRPAKLMKKETPEPLIDANALIAMPNLAYPLPSTEIKRPKMKTSRTADELLKKKGTVESAQIDRLEPPLYNSYHEKGSEKAEVSSFASNSSNNSKTLPPPPRRVTTASPIDPLKTKQRVNDMIFLNLLRQVKFIAEHFRRNEEENDISDDWTFVAMVLDRLFLIIFAILNSIAVYVILQAPSLYDTRQPVNITIPTKPLGQANIHNIQSTLF
uniref:Neurotransmitter-gated ion-channel ligand-binding domain-containing protein n=1 Tax=Panagrellus redivivus TaxID=6233 RepID=A0A7E4UXN2_PANRE